VTPGDAHPLFRSAVLELSCAGGVGGGSAEVSDGLGTPLASSDPAGTIADPGGTVLLRAPLRFEGRDDRGTNAMLDLSGPDGAPLGEVRVQKFSVGPRSRKATLSVTSAGAEVARLEPEDGEESAITAGGRAAGTLRRTGKRGFIRSRTQYRLELTGEIDQRVRPLLLAAAIRQDALLTAAASAGQGR
jgi:hypothetical protein